MDYEFAFICFLIAALVGCIFVCIFSGTQLLIRKVELSSERYQALLLINSKFDFDNDLKLNYSYSVSLSSKVQFDHFDFSKYFFDLIEENFSNFKSLIHRIKANQGLYHSYLQELENLPSEMDRSSIPSKFFPFSIYNSIEKHLVDKITLSPITEPKFTCDISYVSPKGRKSYHNQHSLAFCDLCSIYQSVIHTTKQREEFEQSKAYQRQAMTPSLRYDIMKRDGFRCVICGRSAKDGVQLHVDHILPVSKGGKTIPSNLRTLCSECNLGKSAKWDALGPN